MKHQFQYRSLFDPLREALREHRLIFQQPSTEAPKPPVETTQEEENKKTLGAQEIAKKIGEASDGTQLANVAREGMRNRVSGARTGITTLGGELENSQKKLADLKEQLKNNGDNADLQKQKRDAEKKVQDLKDGMQKHRDDIQQVREKYDKENPPKTEAEAKKRTFDYAMEDMNDPTLSSWEKMGAGLAVITSGLDYLHNVNNKNAYKTEGQNPSGTPQKQAEQAIAQDKLLGEIKKKGINKVLEENKEKMEKTIGDLRELNGKNRDAQDELTAAQLSNATDNSANKNASALAIANAQRNVDSYRQQTEALTKALGQIQEEAKNTTTLVVDTKKASTSLNTTFVGVAASIEALTFESESEKTHALELGNTIKSLQTGFDDHLEVQIKAGNLPALRKAIVTVLNKNPTDENMGVTQAGEIKDQKKFMSLLNEMQIKFFEKRKKT